MVYTQLDIEAAIEIGFKPSKGLADALATQAAYDAQEAGTEAAQLRDKLSNGATAKEAAELLTRLADIELRKNALARTGLRRSIKERVEREWNAVREAFTDDFLATKLVQFDAVNEVAPNVPLNLAQDISAALESPAEQATAAVQLHAAVKALNASLKTASRFGSVRTPQALQSRMTRILRAVKELAEWTDFSGSFKDAFELVQPLRQGVKSGSGMTVEEDPFPLFSAVGAVLVANAGLKFVNRSVAERRAAVQRVADDAANWAMVADWEGGKLVPAPEAAEAAQKAEAEARKAEFLRNAAGALGVGA